MEALRSLNVIAVSGKQFLLTATAGDAIHLTRAADSAESAKAAVPDHYVEDFERTYDRATILAPIWAETTLCGRPWILMEGERDGEEDGEATYAPSCRRCLALLDKLFPPPQLNERFPLIVQIITDAILEHGTAEMQGVPGDQQAALRREVRTEVKQRTGYRLTTHAHESMVIFICDPIYQLRADQHSRRMAETMNAIFNGQPVPQPPATRLSWGTWASS
jgi:hypothetical protein